ncbi:MAG TPA: DMT family transporter [Burkholderiales bacterium]|nr:DMT family transporter [Burkholderiales bacterium]
MTDSRAAAFFLLAAANLFWAGNWVLGRALRDAFDPISLNFYRWLVALVALAPFALPGLAAKRELIRRHAGLLALLALLSVSVFQTLVYLGLKSTTAVNAVLINCAGPLFIVLSAWALDGERTTLRQLFGILVSVAGILVILSRGEPAALAALEFHSGDAWIVAALAIWGVYSVLLKRRPPGLGGVHFLFVLTAAGVVFLAPAFVLVALHAPPRLPSAVEAIGVVYMGLAASVGAFLFWNRGVIAVGAAAAGFTLYLLPSFATLLAIAFLGESFGAFHAVGIATILAGVILATRR